MTALRGASFTTPRTSLFSDCSGKDAGLMAFIKLTYVKMAKDLGVVSHAGVRRYNVFLKARLRKARARTERIITLVAERSYC